MNYAFEFMGPIMSVISLIAIFAFIGVGIALIIKLAILPGQIARRRGHPQAEAINVCGIVGIFTLFFWFVALVWAFTSREGSSEVKLKLLAEQVARLEESVAQLEQLSARSVP